jgi:L-serine dehydratase
LNLLAIARLSCYSRPGVAISVLDMFTIGIGPSSSHTVGPMRAARRFVEGLAASGHLERIARIEAHLYGSLALTGLGHGTDRALMLGFEGETPEGVDLDGLSARVERIRNRHCLELGGRRELAFDGANDLRLHRTQQLPAHPNGMRFVAYDAAGTPEVEEVYYSVGGGFVVNEQDAVSGRLNLHEPDVPFPYRSGDDLLRFARESGLSVSEMTLRNEAAWRPEPATRSGLLLVWRAMQECVNRGCRASGALPGELKVARRAPRIFRELTDRPEVNLRDPVGGRVQVPCIERNAMGAVEAINAARLALAGDGTHRVSLDRVIATMRQTGADMNTKYKETSRGGLAVNVVEC